MSSTTVFSYSGVKKHLVLEIKNPTLKKRLQLEKVREDPFHGFLGAHTIPPGSEVVT